MSDPEPPARSSRWTGIATVIVVIAILIGGGLFYPPARAALDSARRSVTTLLGAAEWDGYYLRLDPNALPGEVLSPLLLFAAGEFPGQGVSLVDAPVFAGRWSPSGELFAFTSGRRLLMADKKGTIRSLGDLLDLTPAGPPVWLSENELVLTMSRTTPPGHWFVRIDVNGLLLDQRALSRGLVIESASADGMHALARSALSLDLVDLSDGTTSRAPAEFTYVGWAPDGRVLLRVISAGRYKLEARHVGAKLGDTLADLPVPFEATVRGRWIVLVEHDPSRGGTSSIWLTTLGEEARRVLGDLTDVSDAGSSRDGRYVTFTTGRSNERGVRTGVVNVETGAVTFACEAGCLGLRLR